jgi:hypothetical protein
MWEMSEKEFLLFRAAKIRGNEEMVKGFSTFKAFKPLETYPTA